MSDVECGGQAWHGDPLRSLNMGLRSAYAGAFSELSCPRQTMHVLHTLPLLFVALTCRCLRLQTSSFFRLSARLRVGSAVSSVVWSAVLQLTNSGACISSRVALYRYTAFTAFSSLSALGVGAKRGCCR